MGPGPSCTRIRNAAPHSRGHTCGMSNASCRLQTGRTIRASCCRATRDSCLVIQRLRVTPHDEQDARKQGESKSLCQIYKIGNRYPSLLFTSSLLTVFLVSGEANLHGIHSSTTGASKLLSILAFPSKASSGPTSMASGDRGGYNALAQLIELTWMAPLVRR
jgi:hypothetical protein